MNDLEINSASLQKNNDNDPNNSQTANPLYNNQKPNPEQLDSMINNQEMSNKIYSSNQQDNIDQNTDNNIQQNNQQNPPQLNDDNNIDNNMDYQENQFNYDNNSQNYYHNYGNINKKDISENENKNNEEEEEEFGDCQYSSVPVLDNKDNKNINWNQNIITYHHTNEKEEESEEDNEQDIRDPGFSSLQPQNYQQLNEVNKDPQISEEKMISNQKKSRNYINQDLERFPHHNSFQYYEHHNMFPEQISPHRPHGGVILPAHSVNVDLPHGGPFHLPHGEPFHLPHGGPFHPPHGEPFHPPHGAPLITPHGTPLITPHGAPLITPHGAPLHSPYGAPLITPHGPPLITPHGAPLITPHGPPLITPHGVPLITPHGPPLITPHGVPLITPHGASLYPPNGAPLYPPHGAPLPPPHGDSFHSPHGVNIHSPHGNSFYPPHGGYIHLPHGESIHPYHGNTFNPNKIGTQNQNIKIPLPNRIIYGKPVLNEYHNNIQMGLPINHLENEKIEGIKENNNNNNNNNELMAKELNNDEKKIEINLNNEQNKGYDKVQEYNPNPNLSPYAKFELMNEMEYNSYNNYNFNFSGGYRPIDSKRIEKIYSENNNTILEENEENYRPSVIITEININQETKNNLYINVEKNEEIEKEDSKNNNNEINNNKEIKNQNDKRIENEENEEYKNNANEKENIDENKDKIQENKQEKDKTNEIGENQEIAGPDEQNVNYYEEPPLYIDTKINKLLIDQESSCLYETRNGNNLFDTNSFPIILIKEDKIYKSFIRFIETNYKYKEFNFLPMIKQKFILPKSSINDQQYQEYHNLKKTNINKFANITNSNECLIYNENERNDIIYIIKNHLNNCYIDYDEFMDKWIHIVLDLLVEYIQFKLKKISYYYFCENCKFPYLYISDLYDDDIYSENDNNDLLVINNSINIFGDLMKVIDIHKYNNKNNIIKENIINVIYYEEEYNYINYSFEEYINGAFIPCNNMKSLEKAMIEIHNRNLYKYEDSKISINSSYDYMFELIIAQVYTDKIFNYLINSNFFKFFKGICILIEEKENSNNDNILLQIKKKYAKYLKNIYIIKNDILLFLKKEKEETNYRNNKIYDISFPIIDYNNYLSRYYKLHQGVSVYYNRYSLNSYQIIEKVFLDFLISIMNTKYKSNNQNSIKKIIKPNIHSSKKQNKNDLLNIIKIFDLILGNLREKQDKLYEYIYIIVDKYKNEYNSFYYDFNNWLNNTDQLAHQKICYFIGSLMYSLDNSPFYYNNYNNINTSKNNDYLILYKEITGNDIDVIFYQLNKNQVITFPSFLFCSKEIKDNSNYENNKDKYNIIYRIKLNLNNMKDYPPIFFEIIQSFHFFQLFTFFKIVDVKMKQNTDTIFIDLEPIFKKEYLEFKLKENEVIFYNNNLNIMESMQYENNNNNNSNMNNSDISNNQNQSNIDNTSDIKISKYLDFFNSKYKKNLTEDMTSISLENSNLRNIGLLTLSKIKFKELIILNLDKNDISDLTPLKVCKFQKLKKLSICSDDKTPLKNKIQDISPLANCNFPDLFILNLKHNLISDLTSLLFMNFPNLIMLDLSYNRIESIHVFSNVNFPKLETLDLCNNLIYDVTPLITTSGKKYKILKNIESKQLLNSNSGNHIISAHEQNNEYIKKNYVLPGLKTLKIKHNKIIIDEGFLMVIKALRNRGITIFK